MNRHALLCLLSLATASVLVAPQRATAEEAPAPAAAPAPAPFVTATTNVNVVSDYRFRGIDQTWGHAAVQGGADLTVANGLYAGTWLSNVSGNSYPGGSLELDLYAGYNGKFNDDAGYTVGGYGYVYPGANYSKSACPSAAYPAPCAPPSQSLKTFELNGGVNRKWVSYKLSLSFTDYFGANAKTGYSGHTSGTMYHDLTVTVPLNDTLSLAGHVGRTNVKGTYGTTNPDYTDYRLTLTQSFKDGWSLGAAVAGANNDAMFRAPTGGLSLGNGETRSLNKAVFILQAGRQF
jgi:uncharacterized protein (TIGR02001 family)